MTTERTPDGRHVVVDGRRWRATDPGIPDTLRAELVSELMAARRTIAAAKRADDKNAEQSARRRVHDAKVALGERGHPWWEPAGPADLASRRVAAARALARNRDGSAPTDDELDAIAGG